MDGIKSMVVNFEPNKENHGSNKRVFKKNQIKVMLPLFHNREYTPCSQAIWDGYTDAQTLRLFWFTLRFQ